MLIQRRTGRKKLGSEAINRKIVERPYQHRAIRNVARHFEQDGERKALLVMATGSGKTRTVIALVDLLMRAGWVKRVLFLADRVALVNQAAGAFKAHLPDAAPVNLVTERTSEGRVFLSTYPTMMNLIDGKQEGKAKFGPGHFDLIVIDEAHRSVYQRFRAIFEYFDCFLVGLTATPKDEIDKNTYSLFDLEDGVPTDAYSLDEAVADGYLVPPKAISVPLKIVRSGLRYDDLSEEEKDQWDMLEWGEEEIPDSVEAAEVNKRLFNEDTVDLVIAHLMQNGLKVEGGDRLGKTIIFAKNQAHAKFIEKRFNAAYPHSPGISRGSSPTRPGLCPDPDRRFLDQDQGAAYRHLRRYARHRHRRAGGRQSRLLQAGSLEDEVLADDRPRHAAVPRSVRPRPGQGVLPCLRLLPEPRILRRQPGTERGERGEIAVGAVVCRRGSIWCARWTRSRPSPDGFADGRSEALSAGATKPRRASTKFAPPR